MNPLRSFAAAVVMVPILAVASVPGDPVAFVVAIKGKVDVVSAKGGAPQPAFLGRPLEIGDKVHATPASSATLFFSNGKVIDLAEKGTMTVSARIAARNDARSGSSVSSETFAAASKFLVGGSRQSGLTMLAPLRGGGGEQTPIILSPRRSAILTDRPAYAWRAVKGATRYRVTVTNDQGEVWKREVPETTLDYPADAPALSPDTDYLWEVDALSDHGPVRQEESAFHVLPNDEAGSVRDQLSRIVENAGGQGSEPALFMAGSYLFGRELYQDAAQRFEALSRLDPESPGPHEALGKTYGAMGLTDLSAAEFQKALSLGRKP